MGHERLVSHAIMTPISSLNARSLYALRAANIQTGVLPLSFAYLFIVLDDRLSSDGLPLIRFAIAVFAVTMRLMSHASGMAHATGVILS